jgi:hypothetical protein
VLDGTTIGSARRAPLAALVPLALALSFAPTARAQDAPARETAERVHDEGRYPSDVTVFLPEPGGDARGGTDDGPDGRGRGPRGETGIDSGREEDAPPPDSPELPFLRDFLRWLGTALEAVAGPLGWVFLALAGALLVMLIVFFVVSMRFGPHRIDATSRAGDEDDDAPVDPLLLGGVGRPDELAAQGRFREAIHALFLESLERVGGTEGRQRARTARELVRGAYERDAGRRGGAELQELLELTELVWFGGRSATEAQYCSARALRDVIAAARVHATPGAADEEGEAAA